MQGTVRTRESSCPGQGLLRPALKGAGQPWPQQSHHFPEVGPSGGEGVGPAHVSSGSSLASVEVWPGGAQVCPDQCPVE